MILNTWGTFEGDISKWPKFAEEFAKVHNNAALNDTEKFDMLKQACSTKLAEMLQALYENDYNKAWNKLNEMYGSTYKQTQFYVQKLLMIPRITTMSSETVQILYRQVRECEYGLKQTKQVETNNAIMMFIVLSKFDENLTRAWERHRKALANSMVKDENDNKQAMLINMPSWDAFMSFLCDEAELYHSNASQPMQGSNPEQAVDKSNIQCTSKQASMQDYNANHYPKCILCPGYHYPYRCNVYKAMHHDAKWEFVKRANLCIRCLHEAHEGPCEDEKSNKVCPKCYAEYHNSTLCPKNKDRERVTAQVQPMQKQQMQQKSWNDDDWDD